MLVAHRKDRLDVRCQTSLILKTSFAFVYANAKHVSFLLHVVLFGPLVIQQPSTSHSKLQLRRVHCSSPTSLHKFVRLFSLRFQSDENHLRVFLKDYDPARLLQQDLGRYYLVQDAPAVWFLRCTLCSQAVR
jgi:hypothetical protein